MVSAKIIIVGSGPSGLMAALELINTGFNGDDILILEKGSDIHTRIKIRNSGDETVNNSGFGGAGLFSDGKFCVPSERFPLTPSLPSMLGKFDALPNLEINENQAINLYKYAFEQLSSFEENFVPNPDSKYDRIMQIKEKFASDNVYFEYYDVFQLNTGLLPQMLKNIRRKLISSGIRIYYGANVVNINKNSLQFTHDSKNIICQFDFLILGVGKSGRFWLLDLIDKLGFETISRPIEIGVRVEMQKGLLSEFTKIHKDFKLFRKIDETSLVKTFCTCEGGKVIPCVYDDILVLGGYTDQVMTDNTNFGLLMKMDLGSENPIAFGISIIKNANALGEGKPIVQRLGDLRKNKSSSLIQIEKNLVKPTLIDYSLKNLMQVFPPFIIKALLETLDIFSRTIPGINQDDILINAPCLEACYPRFIVDYNMKTNIEDVFVIGDVAGYAKGIISAAASGILAARGISNN